MIPMFRPIPWKALYPHGIIMFVLLVGLFHTGEAFGTDVFNLFFAPFTFDAETAYSDVPLVSVQNSGARIDVFNNPRKGQHFQDSQRKKWPMGNANFDIFGKYLFAEKYVQNGKYYFSVKPDEIISCKSLDAHFLDGMSAARNGISFYLCELNGAYFFASAPDGTALSTGDVLRGFFIPYETASMDDVRLAFFNEKANDGNFFIYQLNIKRKFYFERALRAVPCLTLLVLTVIYFVWQFRPMVHASFAIFRSHSMSSRETEPVKRSKRK
jgi:hypothetical protein